MFGTELGAAQTKQRGRITAGDDTRATVRVASHFAARLAEIGQVDEAAFGRLMDFLQDEVMPTLARAPDTGRRLLDDRPDAADVAFIGEALEALIETGTDTDTDAPMRSDVREYAFGDANAGEYRLVYLDAGSTVYLLSIRRCREPRSTA